MKAPLKLQRSTSRIIGWLSIVAAIAVLLIPQVQLERLLLQKQLSLRAEDMVNQSLRKDLIMFTTLSSIKAAVAVIEGATVGISLGASVQVEVGDVVEPALDYLSFVWDLFLYALLLLTFYKLMLESHMLGSGIYLLAAALCIAGLSRFTLKRRPDLLRWSKRAGLIGLALAYGAPAILISASVFSAHYTLPLKEKASRELSASEAEFVAAKDELLAIRGRLSLLQPSESWNSVRSTVELMADRLAGITWKAVTGMLYYLLITMFELLILPILLAVLLSSLLKLAFWRGRSASPLPPPPAPLA